MSEAYFYTSAAGRTPISVCCRGVPEQKGMDLTSINSLLCLLFKKLGFKLLNV